MSGAGEQLIRLNEVMAQLRVECPWDREQTHVSLLTHLIEETCEVVDAVEEGTDADLCEELGDLLLQVYFHARIAQDEGRFTIDDVARGIADKLIRRHPHVFGDGEVPEDLRGPGRSRPGQWCRRRRGGSRRPAHPGVAHHPRRTDRTPMRWSGRSLIDGSPTSRAPHVGVGSSPEGVVDMPLTAVYCSTQQRPERAEEDRLPLLMDRSRVRVPPPSGVAQVVEQSAKASRSSPQVRSALTTSFRWVGRGGSVISGTGRMRVRVPPPEA